MEIIDLNFQNMPHIISSFLIDAKEPILVETGPDSTFKNLLSNLKALGLNQQDIKHVLITHIHLDHSGAAWHFSQSKAKIYVHPLGAKHLIDPSRLVSSAEIVYKEKLKSLFGNVEPVDKDSIIEVDDEKEIHICNTKVLPIYTKGHAKHHVCFVIDDHMFVGDTGGIRILNGPIIPPTPPPDINLDDWMLSIEKLKQYDTSFICPTHFGCFPSFKHFDELASHIMEYKTFIQNSQDYSQFLKFIDTYFTDQQTRQLYKIANPDEMNFEGLLRYFKNFGN